MLTSLKKALTAGETSKPDSKPNSKPNVRQADKEEDKNKTKKKKEETKVFTDVPELNQAILAFMEFRKSIKKPMTDHAVKLLINKLNGMTSYIPEQIEIINQSIVNGWQGVFPLKNEQAQTGKQNFQKQTKADELDDFYRMAAQFGEGTT